jgi:FKBP-type peptidyl-prolyl cis-trans isomerase (trigger factor)
LGSEEGGDSAGDNEIAIEAISERLTEVTGLAEELDQALHSAQQDCSVLTSSATSTSITSSEPETVVSVKTVMDANPEVSISERKCAVGEVLNVTMEEARTYQMLRNFRGEIKYAR